MKKLHTEETIDEVRKRLYDRGRGVQEVVKHDLTDKKIDVARDWAVSEKAAAAQATDLRSGANIQPGVSEPQVQEVDPPRKKHHYRSFVLIGSLLIFVFVAIVSSLFIYYGGNQISSDNIEISVQGPSSIGGGEVLSLSVSVENRNTVPIESVMLIVKYPEGTQSTGDNPRVLFEDRLPVEDLAPGEQKTIPIEVVIFGEEGSKKEVGATIEYRMEGSSGTFNRDAEPLALAVVSAPLVLRVDNIEKVASGQMVDVTLTAISNASTPLTNLVVSASYPSAFSYNSSSPEPIYNQNVWKIDELLPGSAKTIKVRGVVEGFTEEAFRISFTLGRSNPSDQYVVSSVLAEAKADFVIERPFIDVVVATDNPNNVKMVGQESGLYIGVKNTLPDSVYDMSVELTLEGTAMDDAEVETEGSLFNPRTGTIRWDVSEEETLKVILPGSSQKFLALVIPGPAETEAYFNATVNVFARRVSEPNAQESLIGSSEITVRYSAPISISSQNGRDTGDYLDTGVVPPQFNELTTYTPTIVAEAGANDLTDAVVEFTLPGYIEWSDEYDGEGEITYNPVSKVIQWKIGDMDKRQRKELVLQVGIVPSYAQLGTKPALINTQYFRATDRFSEQRLQSTAPAVTTELSTEMGYPFGNGIVVE